MEAKKILTKQDSELRLKLTKITIGYDSEQIYLLSSAQNSFNVAYWDSWIQVYTIPFDIWWLLYIEANIKISWRPTVFHMKVLDIDEKNWKNINALRLKQGMTTQT